MCYMATLTYCGNGDIGALFLRTINTFFPVGKFTHSLT